MSAAQRIDRLWWAMLAATAASWWIGETGLWTGPLWPLLTVFGLSLFKGLAIALDFMSCAARRRCGAASSSAGCCW